MTDEQVALVQDLIFKTVPGDLADRESEFRADMKSLYGKAKKADKADIAETLAESAIDLKSILSEWNLKNRDRFGDAVCSDGELNEEFEKTVALLEELGSRARPWPGSAIRTGATTTPPACARRCRKARSWSRPTRSWWT